MDLFDAYPKMRLEAPLRDTTVALVGVSTIPTYEGITYFEIRRPRYWKERESERPSIGVGGIGGSIRNDESVIDCLRREVEEELHVEPSLTLEDKTYLIRDWTLAATLNLPPSYKRPAPYMVSLLPAQLEGPGKPDHVAIVTFRTELRGHPCVGDLFGLFGVENESLKTFFAQETWTLAEARAHPGISISCSRELPAAARLHPTLAARAYQILLQETAS